MVTQTEELDVFMKTFKEWKKLSPLMDAIGRRFATKIQYPQTGNARLYALLDRFSVPCISFVCIALTYISIYVIVY